MLNPNRFSRCEKKSVVTPNEQNETTLKRFKKVCILRALRARKAVIDVLNIRDPAHFTLSETQRVPGSAFFREGSAGFSKVAK
ncbi:hypothetical protein KEM66_15650 [Cronobacter sakazakii]|uniref:hypothetical protein n=1 Tax=Cronobacter sakazakii TaxID=28141 RepID=UPI0011B2390A|nr:hypothetical protein [Cronobacter sakazakii]MBR9958684.1 hypothetical protein [Cronobacter sakazakii]